MRCWKINAFGLDNLAFGGAEEPRLGDGQIMLRMRAASLNFRDLLIVRGSYNPKMAFPQIPLSDGVGEVIRVADDVKRVKLGDRVALTFSPGWLAGGPHLEAGARGCPHPGVLSEYVVADADDAVKVPAHLSDVEAACLPCAAVTAWNALYGLIHLKPGDKVLILGTGGAALFGVQLAKLGGAEVAITSSSDDKLARAKALGADHLINYARDPEWGNAAKKIFGDGADVVLELGGAGTLEQSLRATRRGGEVMLIGNVTGNVIKDFNVVPIFMRSVRLHGVMVGHRDNFEAMNKAIALHKLRPVVDQVFPFADARAAYDRLASGSVFGKIAIEFPR